MERRFRVWRNVTGSGEPNDGHYCVGDIISLKHDDGTRCPLFKFANGSSQFVYLHNLEEISSTGRALHRFDFQSTIINSILIPVSGASLVGETLSARRKRLLMK